MKKYLSLILIIISNPLFADFGPWVTQNFEYSLNDKWSLSMDSQYRMQSFDFNREQLLLRPSLMRKFKKVNISAGYAFIETPTLGGKAVLENRLYQEFFLKQKIAKLAIGHRYRFEERFINSRTNSGTDFDFRFRYNLFLFYPVLEWNNNQKLIGTLYNEIFVDEEIILTQNRLYFGAIYKKGKHAFGAGKLFQSFERNNLRVRNRLVVNYTIKI